MSASNSSVSKKHASVFELSGVPAFGQALPLALQHVVAMIVGCVTPSIIIAGVAGISDSDRVILIQAALFCSAISTLLQLFPFIKFGNFQLGSALPVIMGISFAYVPSMQAIAGTYDIATILGAQVVGGVIAIIVGLFIRKIRVLFPPLVTGTVVFTIGLSLYPTAVNYMAGGTSSETYGSWQNWLVAFFTLAVVTGLNHFAKGFLKLASILIGIIAGYILAIPFGLVDLSGVQSAGWFQLPQPMHFSMSFEPSACVAIGLLFAINSIQAIGDFSATTSGSMNRMPENKELQGGIVMYGISNILCAFFGGLPTATYSQNVGIVTTTKVINRCVLGLAAIILMIAGFVPKFSGLLTTIPQCVLGGATISVFASIAMTGIKLIFQEEMNFRNTSIVGLSVALGMGITQASGSLAAFPEWVTTVFGSSPVVIATLMAILLNIILPREEKKEKQALPRGMAIRLLTRRGYPPGHFLARGIPSLFNIFIIQSVKISVISKYMDQRKDLDKALVVSLLDEFPELHIFPGIADTAHLHLRLPGIATHGIAVDRHAFVDLIDNKILDLFHILPDHLHIVQLRPKVEHDIIHTIHIDELSRKGVGQLVQAESQHHK